MPRARTPPTQAASFIEPTRYRQEDPVAGARRLMSRMSLVPGAWCMVLADIGVDKLAARVCKRGEVDVGRRDHGHAGEAAHRGGDPLRHAESESWHRDRTSDHRA